MNTRLLPPLLLAAFSLAAPLRADPPSLAYLFPAGGQRGTKVQVRAGGHYLHDRAAWEVTGGLKADAELVRTERVWFEGPLIRQPASQQKEDYPQDYAANVEIPADAATGAKLARAHNAQGVTPPLKFIVGHLPEVIEREIDGQPIPVPVTMPVTINGRVFPREDVDAWTFKVAAGEAITCSVAAEAIGSALQAHLEVRDPRGRVIGEADAGSGDPMLRFTASEAGEYQVRVCDAGFNGLQHYVYRLTITADPWADRVFPLGGKRGSEAALEAAGQKLPERVTVRLPDVAPGIVRQELAVADRLTNAVLLDIDELDEVVEPTKVMSTPGIANGRIAAPGERDTWTFTAKKDVPLSIELRAARLGSPLDGVLVIKDAAGKEIARADDISETSADAQLAFTPPSDGTYTAEVSDKFASRGGPAFAYRLRIAPAQPDYRLTLAADSLAVDAGTEKKIAVNVERLGGFKEAIKLTVAGLPAGASAAEVAVPANQNKAEITIKLDKSVPVQVARLNIIGRADVAGQALERRAVTLAPPGEAPLDHLLLAATLPTPFKYKGQFEFKYVPRGGAVSKTFAIERGGYEGPIEVRLADKQGRHLQGVAGPTIVVPAGESEFQYTLSLPPWMELGRTSRSNLMLTGEVADAAGKKHKVCFSTTEQNEQLIALVSPAPLRLSLEKNALSATPRSEIVLPVQIHRDRALQGGVKLELILPAHMKDISAAPIEVAADAATAHLRIVLGESPGPFSQPLLIRATGQHQGKPMLAEVELELLVK